MIVTVFRARMRPEHAAEYFELLASISQAASTMPGFVSRKTFVADDGERVTIVEFADALSQRAWAEHGGHREAQRLARERYYSDYKLQVCTVEHESLFPIRPC